MKNLQFFEFKVDSKGKAMGWRSWTISPLVNSELIFNFVGREGSRGFRE